MSGSSFDALMRQEARKLQGLTAGGGAHINCEPLRDDGDRTLVPRSLPTNSVRTEACPFRIRTLLGVAVIDRVSHPVSTSSAARRWVRDLHLRSVLVVI